MLNIVYLSSYRGVCFRAWCPCGWFPFDCADTRAQMLIGRGCTWSGSNWFQSSKPRKATEGSSPRTRKPLWCPLAAWLLLSVRWCWGDWGRKGFSIPWGLAPPHLSISSSIWWRLSTPCGCPCPCTHHWSCHCLPSRGFGTFPFKYQLYSPL